MSHLMLLAEAGLRQPLKMERWLKEWRDNSEEEEVEHDDGDGSIRDAIETA